MPVNAPERVHDDEVHRQTARGFGYEFEIGGKSIPAGIPGRYKGIKVGEI